MQWLSPWARRCILLWVFWMDGTIPSLKRLQRIKAPDKSWGSREMICSFLFLSFWGYISSLQLTICLWKYSNGGPTRVSLQCYHPALDSPIMLSAIGVKWLQGSPSQMKNLQATWHLQLDTLKAKLFFVFPDVLLVEGGVAKTIPCPKGPCMVSWPTLFPPKK